MDIHSQTLDGLRSKGHTVGTPYMQTGPDGKTARLFVNVNDIAMPIEWAAALNSGHVTLAEIIEHVQGAGV